nr:hypothetical protein [uncultured Glaciecola sp.]
MDLDELKHLDEAAEQLAKDWGNLDLEQELQLAKILLEASDKLPVTPVGAILLACSNELYSNKKLFPILSELRPEKSKSTKGRKKKHEPSKYLYFFFRSGRNVSETARLLDVGKKTVRDNLPRYAEFKYGLYNGNDKSDLPMSFVDEFIRLDKDDFEEDYLEAFTKD